MARAKKATQHVEPEDESQDVTEPEEQDEAKAEPKGGKASISKTDAIRAALAEGMESPEDGTGFIKSRFGIEISKQHFSATKSQIKKKDGAAAPKRKRAARGEKAPAPAPAPQAAPTAQPATTGPDMIGDLEAVKSLVKKLGAEQVRRIVGLFED
ncbi:MAG: hypothetical protein H0U02_06250 [Rubrobacter sp.]|nr:hypothetical protein [Rubrobacter sp.]